MLNLKVAFKEEDIRLWRRIPANKDALIKKMRKGMDHLSEIPVFADLCKFINHAIAESLNVSPDSVDNSFYRLQYCDSDGDWLTINNEQGWKDSLFTAIDEGNKSLKIHVCASRTSAQLGSNKNNEVDVSSVIGDESGIDAPRMISRSVSDPRSMSEISKTPVRSRSTGGTSDTLAAGMVFTPSPPMSSLTDAISPAAMTTKKGLDLPSEVLSQSSFSSLPMTPPCAGQQESLKHAWDDRSVSRRDASEARRKRSEGRVAGESMYGPQPGMRDGSKSQSRTESRSHSNSQESAGHMDFLIEKHLGVACSVCGQEPIVGVRWKCAFCQNFEMCSQCERVIHQLKDDEQVSQYLQRHLKTHSSSEGTSMVPSVSDAARCHLKSHPLIRMSIPLLSSTSQVFDKEQKDFDLAIRKGHASALGSSVDFTRLWQLKGIKEFDYSWQAMAFGLLQIKQQGIQQAQMQQQQQQQQQQAGSSVLPPYQPSYYSPNLFDTTNPLGGMVGLPGLSGIPTTTATMTSSVPSVGQPEGTLEGFDIGGGQVGLFPGIYQDSLGLFASTNSMSSLPGLTSTLGSYPVPPLTNSLFGGAPFVSPALSSVSSNASFGLTQPLAQTPKPDLTHTATPKFGAVPAPAAAAAPPPPLPPMKTSPLKETAEPKRKIEKPRVMASPIRPASKMEKSRQPYRPSAVKIESSDLSRKRDALPQPATPTVSRTHPRSMGKYERSPPIRSETQRGGYRGRSDYYPVQSRASYNSHSSSSSRTGVRSSGPGWRRNGDRIRGGNNHHHIRDDPPSSSISTRTRKRKKRSESGNGPSTMTTGPAKMTAEFISNLTVPDRSEQKMGTVLRKVWTLRNNGVSEWGSGIKLGFLKGNRELCLEDEYSVPNAKPGEVVEVVAKVSVPQKEGRFCAYFRLKRPTGDWFGPRLWVDIFAAVNPAHSD